MDPKSFQRYLIRYQMFKVLKSWSALPSWDDRVNAAVATVEGIADESALLATALTTVKQRLTDVNNYRPSEELIKCPVFLIRPTGSSKYDNCGLLKVSCFVYVLAYFIVYLFFFSIANKLQTSILYPGIICLLLKIRELQILLTNMLRCRE